MLNLIILTTVKATQRKTRNEVSGLAIIKNVTRNTTNIASKTFLYSSVAMT
jgi:hypothetical protein